MGRRRPSNKQSRRDAIRGLPIVPSWIKAGLITGALLIVIIIANSLISEVSLVCYPIQMFAFLANGMLAAFFEADAQSRKLRAKMRPSPPNYMAIGVGAGFIVSIIASIVYLIIWSQLGGLLPPGLDLLVNSPLPLIAIDSIAAISVTLMGIL